jgi:hypothetical protein
MRRSRRIAQPWSVVTVCAVVAAVAVATSAGSGAVQAQQQPPPAFRANVDLITIDLQITPAKDAAMRALAPGDFDISISGRKRPARSATLLHYDTGAVTRDAIPPAALGTDPACVFGFRRETDRTTAHYLVGVDAIDADRKEVKHVRAKVIDKAFAVQRYVWRSPIRRIALRPVGGKDR